MNIENTLSILQDVYLKIIYSRREKINLSYLFYILLISLKMMLDLRLLHLNVTISLIKIIIITFEYYTSENDKLPRIHGFVEQMV